MHRWLIKFFHLHAIAFCECSIAVLLPLFLLWVPKVLCWQQFKLVLVEFLKVLHRKRICYSRLLLLQNSFFCLWNHGFGRAFFFWVLFFHMFLHIKSPHRFLAVRAFHGKVRKRERNLNRLEFFTFKVFNIIILSTSSNVTDHKSRTYSWSSQAFWKRWCQRLFLWVGRRLALSSPCFIITVNLFQLKI